MSEIEEWRRRVFDADLGSRTQPEEESEEAPEPPKFRTGFLVLVAQDGSTIINTDPLPGVAHAPSDDDVMRAARDVYDFHAHLRVARLTHTLGH